MTALTVAVVATAGFSLFHFSVPCILFGPAMPQPDLFRVLICAEKLGIVPSEIGLSINVEHGLEQLDKADIIIVPYWHNPAEKPAQPLLDKLTVAWQRGAEVVGFCLGTYVLACSTSIVPRRTGNLNATLVNAFLTFLSTVMRSIPVTIG